MDMSQLHEYKPVDFKVSELLSKMDRMLHLVYNLMNNNQNEDLHSLL